MIIYHDSRIFPHDKTFECQLSILYIIKFYCKTKIAFHDYIALHFAYMLFRFNY